MTITDSIRNNLHRRLGIVEPTNPCPVEIISIWERTEWSEEFITLMRNRLLMGRMRYGKMKKAGGRGEKSSIDFLKERLHRYELSGNIELLSDIANFALIEFISGDHKMRHFKCEDR